MNYPYVYKLIHKITNEFYIGYRMANKVQSHLDLGIEYTTSSTVIDKMGFGNFDTVILCECYHADRKIASDNAYDIENELISEVFDNPLCLNGHYKIHNGGKRFRCNSHTAESISKQRATMLAKLPKSAEEKASIAEKNRATWHNKSEEDKAKLAVDQRVIIANRSVEERLDISEKKRATYSNRSDEDKAETTKKRMVAHANRTQEEKDAKAEKDRNAKANKSPEDKLIESEKKKAAHANRSPEEKVRIADKVRASWKRKMDSSIAITCVINA